VSAGMSYSPNRLDVSELTFWASPQQGISLDKLEKALIKEIDLLIEKGVAQDEVLRAQKSLINDAVFARDNLGTGAQVLGSSLAIGMTTDKTENWPDDIKSISRDDVNRALRSVLENKHTVTGILMAAEKGAKQ